ncbi:hypothetical protein, partial [Sphingomonas koreensis]|uniref:hypothetical protein n=1 Tax=Sphingomonas koreensis TaxID=93064 RepID=UPI0019D12903
ASRRSYFHTFLPLGSTSIIRSGVRGSSSLPCLSESIDAGLKVSIRASADSLAGTPKAQIMRQIMRQTPNVEWRQLGR